MINDLSDYVLRCHINHNKNVIIMYSTENTDEARSLRSNEESHQNEREEL